MSNYQFELSAFNNLITFIIGTCIGSFVNVIIHRFPLNESVFHPRSHCRKCKSMIPWYRNIPLLSWVMLRGKCATCDSEISIIYPITEFSFGILLILNNYCLSANLITISPILQKIMSGVFLSILLSLAIIDYIYLWIPKSIVNIGIVIGLTYQTLLMIKTTNIGSLFLTTEHIIATFLGYITFVLISKIGFYIFKKPSMGTGDAKIAALLGAWLGIKGLGLSVWLSFFISGIIVAVGLILKVIKPGQLIPFGSFLSISGILVWILGDKLFVSLILLNPLDFFN